MFDTEIKAGMDWLDHAVPQWEARIDLTTLDMTNPCGCILGQIEGDYYRALTRLFPEMTLDEQDEWAEEHGLYTANLGTSDAWRVLTREWKLALIRRRRA
jgi:hypothetical protein